MSQYNHTCFQCSQCFNNTQAFLDKNCVKNMLPTIKAVPGVKTFIIKLFKVNFEDLASKHKT